MAQGDFDFVFHLGDYIYEKKTSETLADFCTYMLFIKLLQTYRLSMQRFPFIVTMDDHEVENDWANGILQPDVEESNQNFLALPFGLQRSRHIMSICLTFYIMQYPCNNRVEALSLLFKLHFF
ncbi:hypothetical protein GM240_12515 [Peribacillus butanolivorans]|nr:hypothetical protein GM240_12515 [Peribacillus butanolivorans]